MPRRKYTVEQIVAKLREAERLQGQGCRSPRSAAVADLPIKTFPPVAPQVRRLNEDEAQRLKALEQENVQGAETRMPPWPHRSIASMPSGEPDQGGDRRRPDILAGCGP